MSGITIMPFLTKSNLYPWLDSLQLRGLSCDHCFRQFTGKVAIHKIIPLLDIPDVHFLYTKTNQRRSRILSFKFTSRVNIH